MQGDLVCNILAMTMLRMDQTDGFFEKLFWAEVQTVVVKALSGRVFYDLADLV